MNENRLKPSFHKEIPFGTRVKVKENALGTPCNLKGEIQGIASKHVFFMYIILLDDFYEDADYGKCKCVLIPGNLLEGEDGISFDAK